MLAPLINASRHNDAVLSLGASSGLWWFTSAGRSFHRHRPSLSLAARAATADSRRDCLVWLHDCVRGRGGVGRWGGGGQKRTKDNQRKVESDICSPRLQQPKCATSRKRISNSFVRHFLRLLNKQASGWFVLRCAHHVVFSRRFYLVWNKTLWVIPLWSEHIISALNSLSAQFHLMILLCGPFTFYCFLWNQKRVSDVIFFMYWLGFAFL